MSKAERCRCSVRCVKVKSLRLKECVCVFAGCLLKMCAQRSVDAKDAFDSISISRHIVELTFNCHANVQEIQFKVRAEPRTPEGVRDEEDARCQCGVSDVN